MKSKRVHIIEEWWKGGGAAPIINLPPVASALSVNKAGSVYTSSYTYSDTNSDLEATPIPSVSEVQLSGTLNINSLHTAVYKYFNLNGISEGATLIKWYLADNALGLNQSVAATTSTYTPTNPAKWIDLGITPVSSKGETGVEIRVGYKQLLSSFNPFTDITWVAAFDPNTAAANLAAGTPFWSNTGTGDDAIQSVSPAASLPTAVSGLTTRSTKGVRFTSASSQGMSFLNGGLLSPYEQWCEIITPASLTGTQTVCSNSNTLRIDISSGTLRMNGVSTGIVLSVNTKYVIRCKFDGTSSLVQVNKGAETPVSFTAADGSGTPKLGMSYAGGSFYNGTIGDLFMCDAVLTAPQVANMWAFYGL